MGDRGAGLFRAGARFAAGDAGYDFAHSADQGAGNRGGGHAGGHDVGEQFLSAGVEFGDLAGYYSAAPAEALIAGFAGGALEAAVEDGIAHIKGYRAIIIHPRCKETEKEAKNYKYKVDRLTGEVTTDIVDADNHCWDAVRYALDKVIQHKRGAHLGG